MHKSLSPDKFLRRHKLGEQSGKRKAPKPSGQRAHLYIQQFIDNSIANQCQQK